MKKMIALLLASATLISLVSCGGDSTDTTSAQADTAAVTEVSDTAENAPTDTASDETSAPSAPSTEDVADISATALLDALKAAATNLPEGAVSDNVNAPLAPINFVSCFGGEIEFDDNLEPSYPEIMGKISEYAFLMPYGKSPVEIDVFKVANAEDVEDVKKLCEDRITKIKESDIKVYSPDVCDVIFPLMTVYAKGNYVMMISVENPDAVKAAADTALAK